jgi:magnesium chelatase family protein
VLDLRQLQKERYKDETITTNGAITRNMIHKYCPVTSSAKKMLQASIKDLGLSMRSYEKILQIARTIGDLNQHEILQEEDIAEAVSYRRSDRIYRLSGELEDCV